MRGISRIRRTCTAIVQGLRRRRLNLLPGVKIARGCWIAPSARFRPHPDGWTPGGTIQVQSGCRISDGVVLAPWGGSIRLDENVYVGPYCVLYGHGGLTIGPNTLIAPHAVLVAANHLFDRLDRPIGQQGHSALGIAIGRDVWIGSGARILDGVEIGDGCVVAAGAVVTRSLQPLSVAVGVPATVVRTRGPGEPREQLALAQA